MHIAIPSFNIKMFLFTDSLFPFLLIHQAVFMLLFSDQNQMSLLKYKIPTYMILFNIFFSIVQYLLEDSLYFSVIPVMGFQPLSSLHLFFFFFLPLASLRMLPHPNFTISFILIKIYSKHPPYFLSPLKMAQLKKTWLDLSILNYEFIFFSCGFLFCYKMLFETVP